MEGGKPERPIPIATPRGLERLKVMLENTKALTDKLLCAILRPRLKAMTALCIITAMKMASISLVSVCRPIARPSKTEWKERAMRRRMDLRLECWKAPWLMCWWSV